MKKFACIIGLASGCLLLCGGQPPLWLIKSELLMVGSFSLVFGLTSVSPRLPGWLRYQEVRGMVLVALGCLALFCPAEFIVSGVLLGVGARMVLNNSPKPPTPGSGLVMHQEGGIRRN